MDAKGSPCDDVVAVVPCSLDRLDEVFELERQSYPSDEMATREKLEFRMKNATDYFKFLVRRDEIIGFMCGTLAEGEQLEHSSMSDHKPNGKTLCVHSVVVSENCRREGLGTLLVKEYVEQVKRLGHLERILLISKAHLTGFYESCGFTFVGLSAVQHGRDQWHELRMELSLPRFPPSYN